MRQYLRFSVFVAGISLMFLGGCSQPQWNSDYNLNQARLKAGAADPQALASADSAKPVIDLPKEEEEKTGKHKKKRNKRYFMGYKVKHGFVKSGPRGDHEVLETFSYLPEFEAPNPYAPDKYMYDSKKRKLYRTRNTIEDNGRYFVLHGPYTKKIGGEVVEEGYFYVGTKHLRWEKYRKGDEQILVGKEHYDKGFLRDAVITYYEGADKKIKEVIPYEYGEVQGTYYRFYENGQVEWSGQYDKGRKVGLWIKHYDFRNRRHYEYQYPKTAYEAPAEPYLLKEYDRHGTLIYEKDKLDKRSQAQR
ncbi:hypothetical protein I2I11_06480 [Pontibacter sp. 172403-2]|uniref:toxin-antitoxin system YwqK family antitoxin n=1 Tax=Pontibacter rufus TaxID=2791028 RepID=UPI0018AF68A7|nr:hypothetical protein [Pontibacter sp. 172403-2]MBF9252930.1 hypothetical protein [Pontibacter sp. 172403-2]